MLSRPAATPAEGEPPRQVRAHEDLMFPWVKPYYTEPLVVREAEGVWVHDAEGEAYLDMFSGILTTSVGHCHPRVVRAVNEQAARLGHTSTLYVTEPQLRAAEQLTALTPGRLHRVAFTNSGTEAVEAGIMAACVATGRTEVVALRYSYSGRSILNTNLTGHGGWRPMPSLVAGVSHAKGPYVYRSPLGPDASEEEQTAFFIDDLVETIETTTSGRPACLIVESVMGVAGFVVPPANYLKRAAEVIRSYGGLYVADEVQSGFGRTGGQWFGVGHHGVEPDIMVMAKGIANGMPVGATVARDEVADAWGSASSISTFGGNPVCMAAVSATLDVMVEEDVRGRASERGAQLRAALESLQAEHPWIGDVRGMGLMQAMEIVDDEGGGAPDPARAAALHEAAREERLLVGLGGMHGHVVRIGPSLLVTEDQLDEAIERLGRACGRAAEAGG